MTELDHILAVHRHEHRRADAALDVLFILLAGLCYGAYRLIWWLA